jgi:hypothetical protein
MRFVIVIAQIHATIATNCLALRRYVIINHVVRVTNKRAVICFRVSYVLCEH